MCAVSKHRWWTHGVWHNALQTYARVIPAHPARRAGNSSGCWGAGLLCSGLCNTASRVECAGRLLNAARGCVPRAGWGCVGGQFALSPEPKTLRICICGSSGHEGTSPVPAPAPHAAVARGLQARAAFASGMSQQPLEGAGCAIVRRCALRGGVCAEKSVGQTSHSRRALLLHQPHSRQQQWRRRRACPCSSSSSCLARQQQQRLRP